MEITGDETLGDLLADPEKIAYALSLLAALERLEVVLTVNGTPCRGAIRIAGDSAVVEVRIPSS